MTGRHLTILQEIYQTVESAFRIPLAHRLTEAAVRCNDFGIFMWLIHVCIRPSQRLHIFAARYGRLEFLTWLIKNSKFAKVDLHVWIDTLLCASEANQTGFLTAALDHVCSTFSVNDIVKYELERNRKSAHRIVDFFHQKGLLVINQHLCTYAAENDNERFLTWIYDAFPDRSLFAEVPYAAIKKSVWHLLIWAHHKGVGVWDAKLWVAAAEKGSHDLQFLKSLIGDCPYTTA